jgi:hypothetical protein
LSTAVPAIPRTTALARELTTGSDAKCDRLCLLINSRNPIIRVETTEEQRFSALLGRVAERLAIPLYTWTITTGLARSGGAVLYNSGQPEQALANIGAVNGDAIFLLKDFARYCDNDRISRKLRDLADAFRTGRRSMGLLSASISLPPELGADAVEFQLGLPSADELLAAVRGALAELHSAQAFPNVLDSAEVAELANSLGCGIGLPSAEPLGRPRANDLGWRRPRAS